VRDLVRSLIRAAACVRVHLFSVPDDELLAVVPDPRAHASLFSSIQNLHVPCKQTASLAVLSPIY
jgi:hypothetical protein